MSGRTPDQHLLGILRILLPPHRVPHRLQVELSASNSGRIANYRAIQQSAKANSFEEEVLSALIGSSDQGKFKPAMSEGWGRRACVESTIEPRDDLALSRLGQYRHPLCRIARYTSS
jgi:hypothetical protein